MARYAITDSANKVLEIIEWDGTGGLTTPVGTTLSNIDAQPQVQKGGTYNPTTQSFTASTVFIDYTTADNRAIMLDTLNQLYK